MSFGLPLTRRQLLGAVTATTLGGLALAPTVRPQVSAGESIPTPGPTHGPLGGDRFLEMLDRLPDFTKGNFFNPQVLVTYGDLAGQLEAVEVEAPAAPLSQYDDFGDYLNALYNLPLGSPVFSFAAADDWYELTGFDITEVTHWVESGEPPSRITLLRGNFDLDRITEAFTGQGYTIESVNGVDVLNGGDDFAIDFERQISRYWPGQSQNVALVDDETLIIAGSRELIEQVLATLDGDTMSIGTLQSVQALVPDELESLAGAMVVTGTSLIGGLDPSLLLDPDINEATIVAMQEEIADTKPLPPIRLALLGTTFGGPMPHGEDDPVPTVGPDDPIAQAQIRALFGSREDAEAALPIIEERLKTGASIRAQQPWEELLEGWALEVVGDDGLLVVRLGLPGNIARRVYEFFYNRDLGFISW